MSGVFGAGGGLAFSPTGRSAQCFRNSNQTLTSLVWNVVSWTSEIDPNNWIDLSGILSLPSGFLYQVNYIGQINGNGVLYHGIARSGVIDTNYLTANLMDSVATNPTFNDSVLLSADTYRFVVFSAPTSGNNTLGVNPNTNFITSLTITQLTLP